MNDKLIYYQNLAAKTVKEIYSGSDYWMTFLNTASKIYKYSFVDQILIHAQMPETTASTSAKNSSNEFGRIRSASGLSAAS